jgi:hypothetical protein
VNEGGLFNEENVAAVLGHLADGSLPSQLVTSASKAATQAEAKAALVKVVQDRVDAVRENLDADN